VNIDIARVITGYIACLLWSESCNGTAGGDHEHTATEPGSYDDAGLADEARKKIEQEVTDFVEANRADIEALLSAGDCEEENIGENFLLSRNHHGTGFWDCGWGERGERLHAAADSYGTTSAYAGDDDQVYVEG
jgi:hypothetical protein